MSQRLFEREVNPALRSMALLEFAKDVGATTHLNRWFR